MAAVCLGLALLPISASPQTSGGAEPRAALAERVIERVNFHRARHGLAPLRSNARLAAAAQAHSETMRTARCFDHVCDGEGDLGSRLERAGYLYRTAAENIAAGFESPETVVDRWMRSDSHRENMLMPSLTEAGVGYAWVPRSLDPLELGSYWTLNMARARDGAAAPAVRKSEEAAESARESAREPVRELRRPRVQPVPSAPGRWLERAGPAGRDR